MKKKITSVILSIFLLFMTTTLFACNKNDSYYYRKVTDTDIIVEQELNNITTMDFIIRPQETIEDLYIGFSFFDNNDNPIIAKSKKLGDVNKGGEYHIQVSLYNNEDDITYKELSKISKYKKDYFRGKIKEEQNAKKYCNKHNFDNGTIIKQTSCHSTGEKIYICKNCNFKDVREIPSKEHEFIFWKEIEAPTTTKPGKYWEICKHCAVRQKLISNPTLK